MDTPKPPQFTPQQLAYLDSQYPDRCPDPKQSDREIWMAVGARRVVEHLRTISEDTD